MWSLDSQIPQAAVVGARLLDINPSLRLCVKQHFLSTGEADWLLGSHSHDFLVDCSEQPSAASLSLLLRVLFF